MTRIRPLILCLCGLCALCGVIAAPGAADSNVSIEYIGHERYGVAGYDTEIVLRFSNQGTDKITDNIVYDVSRYQGATHDKRKLSLDPGESQVVRLQTRLATTILSYQLWDVEYAGARYDPPDRDSGSPFYRANETLVIDDINPDKGSGGDFRLDVRDVPASVPAGSRIPMDISLSNVGDSAGTQKVSIIGPETNVSRPVTLSNDSNQVLRDAVCAPDAPGPHNLTISTANDSVSKTISVQDSNGTGCIYGYEITDQQTSPLAGLSLDSVPRRVRLAGLGFVALLVIGILRG